MQWIPFRALFDVENIERSTESDSVHFPQKKEGTLTTRTGPLSPSVISLFVCLFFFSIITTATSMLLNTTVQFLSAYTLYLKDVRRVKDKDRRKVAPNKSRCPILRRVRPFEVPVYRSLTVTEPWISSKKAAFLVRNVRSGATHQNRFT